ncbi:hypothetical protein M422DRAFT_196771, partial [Sphaerobolus stellatus SS14]
MRPYPSDSFSPSITILRATQAYAGEKLDKLKSNYKSWLDEAEIFFASCTLLGYFEGTCPRPGSDEPRALLNWTTNDATATALLFQTLEKSEWEFIDRKLGAKACWDSIKRRHQNQGPIRQVSYLQDAMTMKFSKSIPLPITAEKLCTTVQKAYDMGEINCELMKCILLLNALTDFPHTRALISREISSSTTSHPVTSSTLRQYLDDEQMLRDSDTRHIGTSDSAIALAAQTKSLSPLICTNCKRSHHTAQYCITSGGGMEGKTIEE